MALPDDPFTDPALEAVLRDARPAPMDGFADQLESTLFPAHRARPARRRGLAALAAMGSLAAVIVVIGFAGGGPLASDGGDGAKAKPGCELVYVTKVAPSGEVVQRPDGSVTVETTRKPVTHQQQRCK